MKFCLADLPRYFTPSCITYFMSVAVTIVGLSFSIAGLAGLLQEKDPCYYKSTITLLIGLWASVPQPKPTQKKKSNADPPDVSSEEV